MGKEEEETIILIAEDDDGHADLIKEGLEEAGVCNEIMRFSNGAEVWAFLSGEKGGESRDENKHYLLLLDINMPVMDGMEVLRKMKDSAELKKIPVIMLTTTDNPAEIEECYGIGCSFYVVKPVDFNKFAVILKNLGLFIQIVRV